MLLITNGLANIGNTLRQRVVCNDDVPPHLCIDVARYKYPPVWVGAAELFDAMNTRDADNQNRTRGFVLIAKTTRQ